jgi:hypothetical protein
MFAALKIAQPAVLQTPLLNSYLGIPWHAFWGENFTGYGEKNTVSEEVLVYRYTRTGGAVVYR